MHFVVYNIVQMMPDKMKMDVKTNYVKYVANSGRGAVTMIFASSLMFLIRYPNNLFWLFHFNLTDELPEEAVEAITTPKINIDRFVDRKS